MRPVTPQLVCIGRIPVSKPTVWWYVRIMVTISSKLGEFYIQNQVVGVTIADAKLSNSF